MPVDSRKNEMYMSWSSDGESSIPGETAPHHHASKGSSTDNNYNNNNGGGPDTDTDNDINNNHNHMVTPVSPSESPSSPAQVDFYTYSGDDDEEAAITELDKGEERKDPWKKVAIVLILAVLGVGLYLWLGNKARGTKDPAAAGPTNQNDPNVSSPGTPPTSPGDTTSMPSMAPTVPRIIFDPPSAEDCIAIARGETLEGEAEMMVETYEVVLDVAFDSGGLAIDGILNRMASEIRQTVLPDILGCGDANRRLMMEIVEGGVDGNPAASATIISSMIRGSSQQRKLNSLPSSSRYIMANAKVSVRNPSGEWCAAGSGPLCYRVIVSFDMAFRSDGLKVLSVVEFIAESFKTQGSLLEILGLGRPFQNIFVRDVYPAFPTAIPTSSPSHF